MGLISKFYGEEMWDTVQHKELAWPTILEAVTRLVSKHIQDGMQERWWMTSVIIAVKICCSKSSCSHLGCFRLWLLDTRSLSAPPPFAVGSLPVKMAVDERGTRPISWKRTFAKWMVGQATSLRNKRKERKVRQMSEIFERFKQTNKNLITQCRETDLFLRNFNVIIIIPRKQFIIFHFDSGEKCRNNEWMSSWDQQIVFWWQWIHTNSISDRFLD